MANRDGEDLDGPTTIHLDFAELDRELDQYKKFLADLYEEHSTFVHRLAADIRFAGAQVKENDDPYRRRAYSRAAFEFIEGALYSRRRVIREIIKHDEHRGRPNPPDLTAGELALLHEIQYELRNDGTVGIRSTNFQPFLKYLRFTFAVDFKLKRQPNPVDYSDARWESLQRAHRARNRIAHPKSLEDLAVSDIELLDIREALEWFADQFNKR